MISPTEKSLSRKVAFFCSPIGLGHATRDIAVASLFEKTNTKFVTGAAAAKLISECGFDVDDSYRPPKFEVKEGRLEKSLKWLWQYYQYYKDCKVIARNFIKTEKPDIIISDEDFASISIAHEEKIPTVLITDILQTRFTSGFGSIIEKKMNKSMQDMIKKCNFVILPEFGNDKDNIRYVGPIVRETKSTREDLREKLSFVKKTITVSVGGTDAGRFLIDKMIQISKNLGNVDVVIVSGPLLQTRESNIRNLGFVNNLHEIIYASDLIVSLAGKSTIDEAKVYGTPGIFIPIKNHFEQEDNARTEGYTHQDLFRLEEIILKKLNEPRHRTGTSGAQKAWQVIKQTMTNT
ncbi:Glycosyltransferase 28 domain [Candidatus Nitrosotenuis uzonensis]|uniref:Glycosyltransferase 28 domain n=1 Tax=Candidatus Nitrosotenuis uzonensis TaxID=1407055 RepID=A0A812F0F9_9ARCH|nr:Glycosyltransferase 28 domain [Candidatus Nitrosotenuis uzonensis]